MTVTKSTTYRVTINGQTHALCPEDAVWLRNALTNQLALMPVYDDTPEKG